MYSQYNYKPIANATCAASSVQVATHRLPTQLALEPNTRFQVSNVQQKLKPEHLLEDAAPGGFPDEICLTSADVEVAQAVPKDLMLKLGRQQINDDPSALLGALLRR